jgi:hypothetical protein
MKITRGAGGAFALSVQRFVSVIFLKAAIPFFR